MNRFLLIFLITNFFVVPFSFAGEDNVYSFSWLDPDKEVYVLQNRKFRKKGKVHLNAGFGMTTSGAFVDATSIQARAGFFFKEDWGVDFVYAQNSGEENGTAASVRNAGSSGSVPFRRITDNYMGGMLMWSPFYMKINTFNTILYVDWMIGIGYAKLQETNNKEELINATKVETTETHGGIMWGTALKFFVTEMISVRADLTAVHYEASKIFGGAEDTANTNRYQNFDLSLAIGLNF